MIDDRRKIHSSNKHSSVGIYHYLSTLLGNENETQDASVLIEKVKEIEVTNIA